jgi:putative redox protein
MVETRIKVGFPGGKAVDATIGERSIRTDQSVLNGGAGSAPEPFALFLASIGTCAGFYALSFCEQRGIAAEDLSLEMVCRRHATEPRYDLITLELKVPADFPDKYRKGVQRAMDLCAVKKHIINPPDFEVTVSGAGD